MSRRSVARVLLALLTIMAALSAPTSAVLHGRAHGHEAAEQALHAHAARAHAPATLRVEPADADESHVVLHATCPAPKPSLVAPALPFVHCPNVTPALGDAGTRAIATSVVMYASHYSDPTAQPRAPPLG